MSSFKRFRAAPLWWALVALPLVLAACGGARPGATPTPTVLPAAVAAPELSSAEARASVSPDMGGTIALETGADITFPAQSLSDVTTVTFRTAEEPQPVPVPRSAIGPTYELELEEGGFTGIALVRLPLPPGVSPDTYELAPYRWNGSAWERVTGKIQDGYLQFGVSQPGQYGIQGQWRFADAAAGLVKTDAVAGQESIPLTVVGQYRFSALPALTGEFVPARLVLKQDTSGGAGRASGMVDLDATVEEAQLLFRPDPSRPRGLIEFNHVFELRPDLVDLKPGSSTRFYTLLEVQDSAAPTRRVSSGVESTQLLPIQIIEGNVVRPLLPNETRYSLRWNVSRDGEPFFQEQATDAELPIQPIINRGGLGDYRVVLEVEQDGAWAPVSNEVSFLLALRPSATPEPGQEPRGTAIAAIATPTLGMPGTIPVPPTRRPTPAIPSDSIVATPTVAVIAAASAIPSAEPTRINGTAAFFADKTTIVAGECANLTWQVTDVIAVFLDGAPVTGSETRPVCPKVTTVYTLRTQTSAGFQDRTVTIIVSGAATGTPATNDIVFTADVYQVTPPGCAVLTWRAQNVREVFLNNEGVAGEATRQVCPTATTVYTLRVVGTNSQTTTRTLTITTSPVSTTSTGRFWAERYTLPPDGCTNLHWRVLNVREVFLDDQGVPGEGSTEVCPGESEFYSLLIVDNSGQKTYREITLWSGDPGLSGSEVIAQGAVTNVSNPPDIDPDNPGDQRGYVLTIDGINLLFSGSGGFGSGPVTLRVPQEAVDYFVNGPVDWPIRTGQQVEFRAGCTGNTCAIDPQASSYLFLRSE